ncbi:NAD-dependent epimerase/dehydratase family protein [Mesohalobacter halotolerans]|uniref:NAD-dependent epimerase/dehydratase family protein n=1 Tax=Mesohalobacter halotolerans TaxID=1883405 RepID=A0A4U5TP04_9FLAO|nr:GDP-mannose 4,6-dehydratase [Mesohalobacter halotolerans]TKS55562.1 NAD-dependent epimerase/dehydratase family protein [Mesohalobacter halotolerans]
MKVLVTGAAGFIGSHTAEYLALKDYKVYGLDNLSNYYDVSLKQHNAESITDTGVKFIKADLRFPEQYQDLDKDFDFIIHFAAQPGLSKDSTFQSYVDNNILATYQLIQFAKQQKHLKHFFNISTSSVYGKYARVSETVAPQPISSYGVTKLAAEQMVLSESRQQNLKASSFRLYSVYGPRERPDKLFTKLIECALNDKKFPLYEGSLKHFRSYTYVGDIVKGIYNALKVHNAIDGEIINLGHFEKHSTQEGILNVEKILKKHIQLDNLPARPGDQQETQAIIDKAKLLLNYQPKTSFKEGISKQVDWIQSQKKSSV